MNSREINRRNRLLAEAARATGGYHNLAQRIAEKRSAETRKKYQPMESWHGGDYGYRETSSSDSTSCSGSSTKGTMAVVQNGKLTSLDREGAPNIFMRFKLTPGRMREIFPTQVNAQNPKQLTMILSRLIAADAYAYLGSAAETDIRICAIWIDPADWEATVIVATTEGSKAKWRTSKCGSLATTVAGHPIVPYDAILTLEDKIQPIYKVEIIIQAAQKEQPRRRYSKLWSLPILFAATIASYFSISAFNDEKTEAGIAYLIAQIFLVILCTAKPSHDSSFTFSDLLYKNRYLLGLLTILAAATGPAAIPGFAILPQVATIITVMLLFAFAPEKDRPRATQTKESSSFVKTESIAKTISASETLEALRLICEGLPKQTRNEIDIALQRCAKALQFDPANPVAAHALRSVEALKEVAAAHHNASLYAEDKEAISLAEGVSASIISAGEACEKARITLLGEASDMLDQHRIYLANRNENSSLGSFS